MRKLVAARFSNIRVPGSRIAGDRTLECADRRCQVLETLADSEDHQFPSHNSRGRCRRGTHRQAAVRNRCLARQRAGGVRGRRPPSRNQRCDVITLRLAPLDLELLGVQVQTSYISLDVYALRGRVLGNLFSALANAKVTFPRVARDLNSRLHGHSLQVLAAADSLPARVAAAQPAGCQVLKLVLGPLHLDLLGLDVDLYGKTTANPVIVTIDAVPSQGLLGQLLCGLAGGTGVNSLSGLQSLLSSLGLNLSTTQLQHLLNQLGITNLAAGLTQLELSRILQALGLGSSVPAS